ncbi:acyltransferase (plasmid) [Pedobacter sp. BS3]|uniref:acyltransferase family protein n=1 Tax=Pedobacter sp. BS3 TaxID=2567937 RepID=UPI0011EC23F9|nr:acyltransferase [Pedobacter sp. BS3]TZF86215.1 acyltransferase [Pedobacter sp. BS3]
MPLIPHNRLPLLDSLRGLAALIVVVHHYMVFNGEVVQRQVAIPFVRILSFISEQNTIAVLFFFVLSGFCIALSRQGKWLLGKEDTNLYLYRRFKRILPVYWLALLLSIFIGLLSGTIHQSDYSLKNLIGNLLFLQTSKYATSYWFSPYGNNGPLWSLAYEMFFYLFFPFFSFLILRIRILRSENVQWIVLGVFSITGILVNRYVGFMPLMAFLTAFIIWIAGFKVAVDVYCARRPGQSWLLIFFLSVLLITSRQYIPSASIYEIAQGLCIAAILYGLFKLNACWKSSLKNSLKKGFNFCFNHIGHGSYALYALHYPVFIIMQHYHVSAITQAGIIFIMLFLCPILETYLSRQAFSRIQLLVMPKLGK